MRAIALAWPREAAKMLTTILAGAATVVASAYAMGLLLPMATPTAEILARTDPDLRDLGVALLAGTAGAYAQTRASLSSSLIGVAIAVALVPPLATVGLMIQQGRHALALGAFTLFAANLVGIVVAVAVTLLVTRYAPLPRLRRVSPALAAGLGAAVIAVAMVAVPLTAAYRQASSDARLLTAIHRQVVRTLGPSSKITIRHIDITGTHVAIELSNLAGAPPASRFAADLTDEVGPSVTVELLERRDSD